MDVKHKSPFSALEEEGLRIITRINRAGCRNNHATLERNAHDYNSRWKLSLHRRHWNPASNLYIDKRQPWP